MTVEIKPSHTVQPTALEVAASLYQVVDEMVDRDPTKLRDALNAVLALAPPMDDSWHSEGYRECHATVVRRIANVLGIREV